MRKEVLQWAEDRSLLNPNNVTKQALKLVSEVGELCDAIGKEDNEEIVDAIGDIRVVLIILSEQLGLNDNECLESAYNVIKNRKGKTVNGTFIKEV